MFWKSGGNTQAKKCNTKCRIIISHRTFRGSWWLHSWQGRIKEGCLEKVVNNFPLNFMHRVISHLLGIHKQLREWFGHDSNLTQWLRSQFNAQRLPTEWIPLFTNPSACRYPKIKENEATWICWCFLLYVVSQMRWRNIRSAISQMWYILFRSKKK